MSEKPDITDEMIRAGLNAYRRSPPEDYEDEKETVVSIFRAMYAVKIATLSAEISKKSASWNEAAFHDMIVGASDVAYAYVRGLNDGLGLLKLDSQPPSNPPEIQGS